MSEDVGSEICTLSLGAIAEAGGVRFRVWAPRPSSVELVLYDGGRVLPMARDGEYWTAEVPGLRAGARYRYRLDGEGEFPDPCSRSQPEGVHGPSEVVDPSAFEWTDADWRRPEPSDLVIYECHIGTLTPEGTFEAAVGQLPRIVSLGFTAVEVMPVAAFPGRWNWGYDGVDLFAPSASYGGPEGFRRFVDAAHAEGLAVILDVVYNHFGPDGNYTGLFSERYTTPKYHTPWGDALNFDDTGSEHVRRFFVENVLHWLREYHVDGFRFDATFAIQDSSPVHVLAEISDTVRACSSGPGPYLIAETHENDVRYLLPTSEGGYGFDAVWADDFHHAVRTLITGERDGYYADYAGTARELARVIRQGFLYEGQASPRTGRPRGTRAREQPWYQFVYCVQNHDQVGNRAFGQRLNVTASHADFLAASFLLLLLPQTPLVFQGQEFLASTPFLFFTDHEPELGRLVTEGRRREFGVFAAFADASLRELIPDPQAPETFYRSKLDLEEAEQGAGRLCSNLYSALLGTRATDPVLRSARRQRAELSATAHGKAVVVGIETREGRRGVVANFGDDAYVPFPGASGFEVALHTGEPRFGGSGTTPGLREDVLLIPRHSAALLREIRA